MSEHEFDPKCPDCRPVLLDPTTGRMLGPKDPAMVAASKAWDEQLTREQQEACHRVWVKNSRDPADLEALECFAAMMQKMAGN